MSSILGAWADMRMRERDRAAEMVVTYGLYQSSVSTVTPPPELSGKAMRTLHEMGAPCPFCHVGMCRRDRGGRCVNCGAPEGELP